MTATKTKSNQAAEWRKNNPERARENLLAWRDKNPDYGKKAYDSRKQRSEADPDISFKSLINSSKARAKKHNREHTLTLRQLKNIYKRQNGLCALSGIKMQTKMGSGHYMVSPDRIDSNKGYTAKNVQLVVAIVNTFKKNMTDEKFIELCKAIADIHTSPKKTPKI